MTSSSFGGNFGDWIEDEFGLPAYSYMLNQLKDYRKIFWLTKKTNFRKKNWHLLGNDNIISLAVNRGTVEIFSEERGNKYLNYYSPKNKAFSGGFGFIKDGDSKWSMYYSKENAEDYKERIFGMGYYKKSAEKDGLSVEETICTPFGKDTVFVMRVNLKNTSSEKKSISYYPYLGVDLVQLSVITTYDSGTGKNSGFFLHVKPISDEKDGLFAYHTYKRWWRKRPSREAPNPQDFYLPVMFLKAISNTSVNSFETKKKNFLLKRPKDFDGICWADALKSQSLERSRGLKQKGLMVLESKIELNPGEEKELNYIFGYIFPKDDKNEQLIKEEIAELIGKYEKDTSETINNSAEAWKSYVMNISGDFKDSLTREMKWHSYYLRAGYAYAEYFNNYTVQQGGTYSYKTGQNIAIRDPLQHALPMVYLKPELAREVILYTMKVVFEENKEIYYGVIGHGRATRVTWYPSDAELYLFILISEYFLATRDFEFLEQQIPYYPKSLGKSCTVKERLIETLDHFINDIGVGTHGLVRILQGDWNDMVIMFDSWNRIISTSIYGESCLNTGIATYALEKISQMFKALDGNDNLFSKKLDEFTNSLRVALGNEWNGRWYNRAYKGNGERLGEEGLYLSQQPWAIIGNTCTDEEQQNILVENMYKYLSRTSPIGAIMYSSAESGKFPPLQKPGTGTGGGVWYSLNMPLVWGYSKVNRKYAWEEFNKMLLAGHTKAHPGIWEGILSGPDCYNAYHSDQPGKSMPGMDSFPVMVMHSCACPLSSMLRLIGIGHDENGIIISPKLIDNKQVSFKTELIEFTNENGSFSGAYLNKFSDKGNIGIKIDVPEFFKEISQGKVNKNQFSVEINGKLDNKFEVNGSYLSFNLPFQKKNEKILWKVAKKQGGAA